jgi:hypothetical protein
MVLLKKRDKIKMTDGLTDGHSALYIGNMTKSGVILVKMTTYTYCDKNGVVKNLFVIFRNKDKCQILVSGFSA